MAKKPVKQLRPESKQLISKLIDEFDIKSAKDIKDMFSPMLQEMLDGEPDDHLGYEKYEHSVESGANSRNGHSSKTVMTSFGDMDLSIPLDRNSTFELQVAKKHQRDVSDIENKGISTYANGMSTRDISSPLEDIYGIEASAEMISKITDWVASRGQGISLERLTNKEKALVIDTLRERCRLKELLSVFSISKSSYCYCRNALRNDKHADQKTLIRQLFEENNGRYGNMSSAQGWHSRLREGCTSPDKGRWACSRFRQEKALQLI